MKDISKKIRMQLLELQDISYGDFSAALMPTIDRYRVIGVRIPLLRKMAKQFEKDPEIREFLLDLPHEYVEENNLHLLLICQIKDLLDCLEQVEIFLLHIDNWATCDIATPKVFARHKELVLPYIEKWLASTHPYTIRFGIGMLMKYYLDEAFDVSIANKVASLRSTEYYVNMMIAWYFATALFKQWDCIVPILESKKLDQWTHNKTIQKAVESYRISDEEKTYLRTLRWKN